MLPQLHFNLLLAKAGLRLSNAFCACVHECVDLSHFKINLYILSSYEDIFTKFVENVYGCENMSLKMMVLIFKNNMPP